jgi:UDP-glucose 4-epimerase
MPVSFSLVTGAGGFVGRALAARLGQCASLRLGVPDWEERLLKAPLAGATVYHLAARVHGTGSEAEFFADNVEKSHRLALEAARRGARRLVFLSSIKVHGEETGARPFAVGDAPAPRDSYARSKLAAERVLRDVAAEHGLAAVTVRTPLVLGAGARGNLASLLAMADSPWPLPLASINNRRSLVHVDDLARLLVACGDSPAAVGATFIASHRRPASTPALVRAMRRALGRPERLFGIAPGALEATAAAMGQGERMRRLTRSLEAEASAAEGTLGWVAAIDFEEAAAQMARAWRGQAA